MTEDLSEIRDISREYRRVERLARSGAKKTGRFLVCPTSHYAGPKPHGLEIWERGGKFGPVFTGYCRVCHLTVNTKSYKGSTTGELVRLSLLDSESLAKELEAIEERRKSK